MTPWSVNVEVPVNGRVRKAVIELRRDGEVVHKDKRDLEVAKERQSLAADLAKLTGGATTAADLDRAMLVEFDRRQRERREKEEAEAWDQAGAEAPDDPEAESAARLAETSEDIRREAEALLRDPDLMDRITTDVESQGVAGEKELTAALYLVFTSRKLRRPLAARVRGPSTSGKSHVID
ncbi:MAG TPA: hypothetical protein VFW33_04400, partial [Gemmataceae bacterium]|nr:hypothetical protein [Gemmataceae bacterium]